MHATDEGTYHSFRFLMSLLQFLGDTLQWERE